MTIQNHVLEAALAGLLHDVGKFAMRAGNQAAGPWDDEAQREYQYPHAMHSAAFVDSYLPEALKPLPAAGKHYAPNTPLGRIVQLADRLSANADEIDPGREPQQLLSIFCQVETDSAAGGRLRAPAAAYHTLAPLRMDWNTLAPNDAAESDDAGNAYQVLWNEFTGQVERLRKAHEKECDPEAFVEGMLLLLERYTWCIPAAYYAGAPDVSLYDHSRTTAALAACLTAHSDEQIGRWLAGQDRTNPAAALLVGGDISGIQNFIYTITSRGAASALRGRSLYLQLLTEAIARYVLRRLQLLPTNLLQVGGGHFYLLARSGDSEELDSIRRDISKTLLAFHSGDLYLALESTPLAVGDFFGEALEAKWREVAEGLRRAKTRKFSELGDELYSLVFAPGRDEGNDARACQVCGQEHPGTDPGGGATRKCPPCWGLEDLGDELRAAQFMRVSETDWQGASAQGAPGTWAEALLSFGAAVSFGSSSPPRPDPRAQRSVLYALNDGGLAHLAVDNHTALGRKFLVNVTPVISDADEAARLRAGGVGELPAGLPAIKPFEALEHDSVGRFKRLGILRMDVDDMGRIMGQGLGQRAALSRIATLSRMVNLFFEGWAAELARQHNRDGGAAADRLYSIYAGGDDLFFVGAWDAMPELAHSIRENLTRFAAGHPGLRLSGGIVLVSGRYPLYQAAEEAQGALEAAKAMPGKDAINFLGQTIGWERFGDQDGVKGTAHHLKELVEGRKAPRALLQRLQLLYRVYMTHERRALNVGSGVNRARARQVYWGPWHWRAAYYLKRLASQNREGREQIDALRERLSGDGFRAIEWIGLAARWADLLTR